MREALAEIMLCPFCMKGGLEVRAAARDGLEITEGSLLCRACGNEYAVSDGMAYLHRKDYTWTGLVDTEARGWGERNVPGPTEMWNRLPFHGEGIQDDWGRSYWRIQARAFIFNVGVLSGLVEDEGGIFLEPGAQTGWVAKHLSRVFPSMTGVATDVFDDRGSGLGVCKGLIEMEGVYFERVIQDIHTQLLADGSVSFVYGDNTLHHYRFLEEAMCSLASMLRRDGVFVGIEPIVPFWVDKRTLEEADANWRDFRIKERCYYFTDYIEAFERAGLSNIVMVPYHVTDPRERRRLRFDPKAMLPYYPVGLKTRRLVEEKRACKRLFDEMASYTSDEFEKKARLGEQPLLYALIFASRERDLTGLADYFADLQENAEKTAERVIPYGEAIEADDGLQEVTFSISLAVRDPASDEPVLRLRLLTPDGRVAADKTVLGYQFGGASGPRDFSFLLYGDEVDGLRPHATALEGGCDLRVEAVRVCRLPEFSPIRSTALYETIAKLYGLRKQGG
ncbi:MAG TPA: hypothetical protein ENJ37_00025 [Deltaproteobacteria bacterium]|nr:hypothetical protein [Deltaproteobacteria bacterium]